MSLISRLRAVVAGDDFLDSDFDELDYETSDDFENFNRGNKEGGTEMATISQANPFDGRSGLVGLDDDQNNRLRLIDFERIKGGKPFDISLNWYQSMLKEIGQN